MNVDFTVKKRILIIIGFFIVFICLFINSIDFNNTFIYKEDEYDDFCNNLGMNFSYNLISSYLCYEIKNGIYYEYEIHRIDNNILVLKIGD